jgi:hypothetical protein
LTPVWRTLLHTAVKTWTYLRTLEEAQVATTLTPVWRTLPHTGAQPGCNSERWRQPGWWQIDSGVANVVAYGGSTRSYLRTLEATWVAATLTPWFRLPPTEGPRTPFWRCRGHRVGSLGLSRCNRVGNFGSAQSATIRPEATRVTLTWQRTECSTPIRSYHLKIKVDAAPGVMV